MLIKSEIFLSLLIAIFAIGSWIDLNGVWVELPLLVNRLPEGWYLPTYVVLFVQLANIAPILYLTIHRKIRFRNMERYAIYAILFLGSICCVLLSLFWDKTSIIYITGKWHKSSVAFFVLICILSIVDTTSSVTFLPYLVNYPRKFITALYVGEGLSGLIPGIAGLIQGVGGEPTCINMTNIFNSTNESTLQPSLPLPRFSVSVFFYILCGILLLCLLSFALVDNLPLFKVYRISNSLAVIGIKNLASEETGNNVVCPGNLLTPRRYREDKNHVYYIYIVLIGYINFLTNGVLPSIQNYTLMPYSTVLYHSVVTISQIINPIACLLTLWPWNIRQCYLLSMTTIASICSAYLLFLASRSPDQTLGLKLGSTMAAISWFVVGTIFSFLKTILAIEIQKKGHFWLQLCGIATQLGSAFGALLIFIIVAVLGVFKSKPLCP